VHPFNLLWIIIVTNCVDTLQVLIWNYKTLFQGKKKWGEGGGWVKHEGKQEEVK
jgi:hypothetical protein